MDTNDVLLWASVLVCAFVLYDWLMHHNHHGG